MKFKILVVEDQKEISQIVIKYLEKEGFDCLLAEDGFKALELFAENSFHLVILDVMMPGIDGFEVLSEIRRISNIPVIMLTAREMEPDRIKGFDLGADDYVVKPFSPRELMGRVRSILRRVYNEKEDRLLEFEDLQLYTGSMRLLKGDKEIEITSTEFKLLKTLMENKGLVLTREQIIDLAFGVGYDGIDRNIDSYIRRLRSKLEDDPKNPKYLSTKYGAGYVFGGGKQ
ncbi:response regulator transcription factor [Alkalibacter mobilis]|uniref:response regulator transcription factor n=1 Tax=Alkalibacter mobilis TaxID=2787712 RepID=UPI0018A0A837|nr:response regulator transcription factor [Alkalibacter mobilis]MBF7097509.1 response regulator transcription factor [Alkalibacter mobilis]